MIRKLLIIRKAKMRSTLLEEAEIKYVGSPINVSPSSWREEDGLSHYGYVLELKLKEFQRIKAWLPEYATLLDLPEDPETALATVGLRVHPDAE